jgi:transcriptional regulator with XRE-family HTH domain
MNDPSILLRRARESAGLSQRAVAKKARTAQSVVARVELGENSPSWDTMIRLIRATGHTLNVDVEPLPSVEASELDDVSRILRMTPEQRLEEVAQVSRFLAAARHA